MPSMGLSRAAGIAREVIDGIYTNFAFSESEETQEAAVKIQAGGGIARRRTGRGWCRAAVSRAGGSPLCALRIPVEVGRRPL